jgi:hypothetical protein
MNRFGANEQSLSHHFSQFGTFAQFVTNGQNILATAKVSGYKVPFC